MRETGAGESAINRLQKGTNRIEGYLINKFPVCEVGATLQLTHDMDIQASPLATTPIKHSSKTSFTY